MNSVEAPADRDEYIAFCDYHANKPGNAAIWVRPYYQHFKPAPNSRILDIGAYCGANLFYYGSQGHTVVGIEIAKRFVDIFEAEREKRAVTFNDRIQMVHGLAEEYEPDEPFDYCICGEVLEYVPSPAALATAAFNALRPGGEFFAACLRVKSVVHPRVLLESDLRALLEAAGFTNISTMISDHVSIVKGQKP